MEFIDLQTTLAIVVIVTAAVVVVIFDYLKKHEPHGIKPGKKLHAGNPTGLESAPLDYSAARRVSAGVAAESLVPTATASRPPVPARIEREIRTIEMAPPSPSAPSSRVASLPPITIDAAVWERLIGSQPKHNLLSPPDCQTDPAEPSNLPARRSFASENTIEASYRMIREDASVPALGASHHVIPENASVLTPARVPVGMIQQPELEELVERQELFTGLVVSIGVNDSDSSMWHSQGFMQPVASFISTLLGENDFCCRTAYDEFVMVFSGERPAESQRRLNHISERLWDYQLSGRSAGSILFSWGGVQVQDQPLADAVASATERMRETQRSGRMAECAVAHRQFL